MRFNFFQIEAFDKGFKANVLQPIPYLENRLQNCPNLPHFEVDVFIDEVNPFQSRASITMTPILGRIHSVRPNANIIASTRVLTETALSLLDSIAVMVNPTISMDFSIQRLMNLFGSLRIRAIRLSIGTLLLPFAVSFPTLLCVPT